MGGNEMCSFFTANFFHRCIAEYMHIGRQRIPHIRQNLTVYVRPQMADAGRNK